MDFLVVCNHLGIPCLTEGDRHCRPGWLQVNCPFCGRGEPKWHLGFNIEYEVFNCWSCGRHTKVDAIQELSGLPRHEVVELVYGNDTSYKSLKGRREEVEPKELALPAGSAPMLKRHHSYLRKRGYNSKAIERLWGTLGTGPVGTYAHRVIIPVYRDDRLVSYLGRDITGMARAPYLTCAKEAEVVHLKDTLYGMEYTQKGSVVVVEGVLDAWRLGPGAVATFGIGYTHRQVLEIAKFAKRFIVYDNEDEAQDKAERLAAEVELVAPGHTEVIRIDASDPGNMPQAEAQDLMQQLMGWSW